MGKNIKYGEFTFPSSPARPTGMKSGGMCAPVGKYAKGGPKRESEATVRREVALLSKSGAPKALIQHEVREVGGEKDTQATKKAEIGIMRKAKAPLTMIKEEMMEPTGMKKGGKVKNYAKGGTTEAKLEKHANMPAGKAHGPGAGNKLAKGGVPSYSKVPKIGQMK